MSSEQLISKILVDAVKTVPGLPTLVVENEEKPDPTQAGIWIELTQLPLPETSLGKATTDSDENGGILQLSVFDANTGGGNKAALDLADDIKDVFKHGVSFTDSGAEIHIDQSSRNNGRPSGGFFQVDVSVTYRSFVGRVLTIADLDWLVFMDEDSILGENPVRAWLNILGDGGLDYSLDVSAGTEENLITLESGVALLTGTAGDKLTVPDRAGYRSTGDLSWILELSAFDWTPGAVAIIAMSGNTASVATTNWRIIITTDGALQLRRPSGATDRLFTSSANISTSDGDKLFIKIQFDQNNGSAQSQADFSTSTDGVSFSALGAAQTNANTGAGNSDVLGMTIGSGPANSAPFAGKINRIQGYNDKDTTTEVFDCDPREAAVNASTFTSGGDTYTLAGDAFVNATQHTGIYSRGGVGLETTIGQLIESPATVFAVFKPTLAAPTDNPRVFDARSEVGTRFVLNNKEVSSDKYNVFQGAADLTLAEAYDTNLRVITVQFLGTASTKLTISDVGSVTGDAGSGNWDFGAFFMDHANAKTMQGLFLKFLVSVGELSDSEVLIVQDELLAEFS